jgi:hypothetical protein
MLPGATQNRELLSQVSDKDLDRAAAIVNSMTVEERRNPKILNGSRRLRIANGAGVTVGEVNSLVVRFLEGQKMMRQMMGGGMPGMPGMPGMRRGQKAKGKKKGKGGGRPGVASRPGSVRAGKPGALGPGGGAGALGELGLGGSGLAGPGLGRPGSGPPGAGGPGLGGLGLGGPDGSGLGLPPGLRRPMADSAGGDTAGLGEPGGDGVPRHREDDDGDGESQQLPPGLRGSAGRRGRGKKRR